MPERLRQLESWLARGCGLSNFTLAPASEDASFRRYFRVSLADGTSRVAMDAPPDKEDCRPFIHVASRMRAARLHVPDVIGCDLDNGFLLLEDLGTCPYLNALNPDSAGRLYADAVDALLRLQSDASTDGLPDFDIALLMREMRLFPDWLLSRHLDMPQNDAQRASMESIFATLAENAVAQPQVCVHRDYHSRNLMVVDGANPGIIDFQDAVRGPVSYDLVSLLRDCYIAWPERRVDEWLTDYHARAAEAGLLQGVDIDEFRVWFDLTGVQRHLKAAGIFARLWHRDGKPGYLNDIPRTLTYIERVARRYSATRWLADYVADDVLPRV